MKHFPCSLNHSEIDLSANDIGIKIFENKNWLGDGIKKVP